jgi:predicted acyltransferase
MILIGGASLGLGYGLGQLGVCPVVKKIWTPSWVLFSGGWAFLFLAGFYLLIDVIPFRPVFFPLIVIGMNSIAAYCLSHLIEGFIASSFQTHFGQRIFEVFGEVYAPLVRGSAILLVLWLIFFWMYRKKIFVRI